ncbi:CBM 14 domain containing protein, partial [Asbolus verrucosus]
TATESSTEVSNVTKPTLTGIPQVDYIWDPNLPKELNGYNLSSYPFYERVPEDIDFKCDGLHDGFYASVPHKCQVYHHCLFGTRYDFLCANYTAFDQKTFICHFVSEVDCVNSKKYWHRNDALYKAATTTTLKPLILHTTAPPEYAQPQPATSPPVGHTRRPMGGRRRPFRGRRPQYDYYEYDDEYDDYYDERPRYEARRRKRPRPRPRPIYEPDYDEEYEDDRYERRNSGRRNEERNRKPYDRRGSDDRRLDRRRNKDRRKYEDDDKPEDDDKFENERKVDNKRPGERRYHKRRPTDDHSGEDLDRRRPRPKGRPAEDYYEEDEMPQSDKAPPAPAPTDDKPIIKPTSGSSIYDRPRAAPRIKPPVPKNEASKYAYKPVVTKPPRPQEEEEYYDDYEEEIAPKNHRKLETGDSRRHSTRREETRDTRKQMSSASRLRPHPSRDERYEEEAVRRPYKPKYGSHFRERPRQNSDNKKPAAIEDDYDEYEEEDASKEKSRQESKAEKPKEKITTTTTTTTTTTPTTTKTTTTTTKPTTTTAKEMPKPETIVRIVKRPFLPSRGGNPYSSRGLQPVGVKAVDKKPEIKEENPDNVETMEVKPLFKPSPVIIKMPFRQKYVPAQTDSQEEFKPVSNRPQIPPRQGFKLNKEYSGPRTTQKPKLPEPDPLDIEEDEYDVTLNDALNPTLPNLPVRSFPTGFSSANDYNYNHRPRYVLEGASSDYVYQTKPVRQRYEPVPYSGSQDHFVNSDADYKGQYSTINGQSYRPRVTQAYYSSF